MARLTECGNSPPKQSVYDIRLHTKSPAMKNYIELWGGAAVPPPPLDPLLLVFVSVITIALCVMQDI